MFVQLAVSRARNIKLDVRIHIIPIDVTVYHMPYYFYYFINVFVCCVPKRHPMVTIKMTNKWSWVQKITNRFNAGKFINNFVISELFHTKITSLQLH